MGKNKQKQATEKTVEATDASTVETTVDISADVSVEKTDVSTIETIVETKIETTVATTVEKKKVYKFDHDGSTYKMLLPVVELPEMGKRTAAEICLDDDDAARAYLVSCGCLGSVIEIVE